MSTSRRPGRSARTDPTRMATVLYVLAEVVRQLAILVQPVVPASAARLLDQLAVPADARSFAALDEGAAFRPAPRCRSPRACFRAIVEAEAAAE